MFYVEYGGWKMDVSCVTMGLTNRFWALGFAYRDGARKDSELTKEQQ